MGVIWIEGGVLKTKKNRLGQKLLGGKSPSFSITFSSIHKSSQHDLVSTKTGNATLDQDWNLETHPRGADKSPPTAARIDPVQLLQSTPSSLLCREELEDSCVHDGERTVVWFVCVA